MAQNKMLIDASHSEETRVAVVHGNKVEEFDFESSDKRQLRGNIYLAKVTRVEPSLQAAFVDYGGNRHGFLAFSEIHPDYYQIPMADRQALLDEEAEEAAELEEEEDAIEANQALEEAQETDEGADDNDAAEASADEEEKPAPRRRNTRRRKPKADVEATADSEDASSDKKTSSDDEDDELPPFLAAMVEDDNSISEPVADAEEEVKPAPKKRGRPKKVKTEAVAEETATQEPAAEPTAESAVETTPEAPTPEATEEKTEQSEKSSEETSDDESQTKRPRRRRTHRRRTRGKKSDQDSTEENSESNDDDSDSAVDVVGVEDALEEVPVRRPKRRNYKIQEVIKRRQVILVQIVKEERGNKGAALTTYLSLAGRYSVLMPNTARGGGISRKITNAADRKRLKAIASGLDVAKGMGVILRTAGANLHQDDIKRDFEYLLRLWENVRQLTLQSTAPCLVYEEGSLIKRSIRDLYNKDISEIYVAGEEGYKEAKEFMAMLMPSNARHVKLHRGSQPLFARYDVETQLDKMLQPHVTMKSGGYLVINQTEALVAIDINSGRSTKEHSIEDTALQTNLEAADEIARQLRLRDLAGLIVIDFIDMEENRNNRAVEKRLKEALKTDRARIQVGRISHFGLLEMSRQRMRASVLDSTTLVCPTCEGAGHVRSPSSIALHVLRALEQYLTNNSRNNITVKCSAETALFMLNQKRESLTELEGRYGVTMSIEIDSSVTTEFLEIIRGEPAQRRVPAPEHVQMDYQAIDEDADEAGAPAQANTQANGQEDEDGEGNKRRRRRRRRGGNRNQQDENQTNEQNETEATAETPDVQSAETDNNVTSDTPSDATSESDEDKPKRRRRGKRGGRKHKQNAEQANETSTDTATQATEETPVEEVKAEPVQVQAEAEAEVEAATPERKKRRTKEEIEADKIAKAAEREAAKLAKAAEREAAKAEKAAAKEAEKAAKAAEKEALKAAKAAEKAAAKEAENEAKASKTRRSASSSTDAEIVVTSASTEDEAAKKPAKAGWWRRKS